MTALQRLHANNITTTLSGSASPSATTINVVSATGMPSIGVNQVFRVTISSGTKIEIMEVTAVSGTTLTVTRGMEGTTAQAFPTGANVDIRTTANSHDRKIDGVVSSTDTGIVRWSGTTGNVVQDSGILIDGSNNISFPSESHYTNSGHYVGFTAPTLTANTVWKLPTADGTANQALVTDGSKNLSFASVAPTPAALTATNDTNVTLTLGGSPSTALLNAASITAGWSGTLAVSRGGTGAASETAYAVLTGGTTSTGAFQSVTNGSTAGQVLQYNSSSSLPTYSTPTYPSASGTTGQILRSNGTNNVYTTSTFADTYTASNLLYSNGSNTVQGLATANSSVLVTNGSGVPSLSTTLPAGLSATTNFTAGNLELTVNTLQSNNTNGNIIIVPNGSGVIQVGGNATGPCAVQFLNTNGTQYVALKAGTLSANTTWVLPTADGSTGSVMKTDGSGNLGWSSASGVGGLKFISSATPSSGVINFTSIGNYAYVLFVLANLVCANNNDNLWMRTSTDNVNYDHGSTDYYWAQTGETSTPASAPNGGNGDTKIVLTGGMGTGANESVYGEVKVYDPSHSNYTHITAHTSMYGSGSGKVQIASTSGARFSTTAVTAIQFLCSTGNISSGTIYMYGLSKN